MPSEIVDQRHMSSFYKPSVPSSFFSEEFRFPSEKQVGFWKTESVPDLRGTETMSFMSGGNFVDSLELQQSYLLKDPKKKMNFENHFTGTESTNDCWRAPGQGIASRFYGQAAMQSVEAKKVGANESRYRNAFSSNSLSDLVNQKLRLSSSDVSLGQSVETTQSKFVDNETSESLQEIEAKTIGDLLPDEDDLFCSVGGLELDSDNNFGSKKVSEIVVGDFNCQSGRFDNFSSSELPCGERPTRTLFVKNINAFEGLELRLLFEQFGEVQALFTACRHRGFILVSFFDIMAAQNAVRVLQTTSIKHQKLDVHFCIPMTNPSEKDINLGALVVTNLDSSISYDDLFHMFSVYGQIKEIREIPHKRHQKFIEFFDIRAAEAAFSALNMVDIAGIQIEPCCPGDARSGLNQRLALNLGEEQMNGHRGESFGANNGAMHEMNPAYDSLESKFHANIPHNLSSPARLTMMGSRNNQSDDYGLGHPLGQRNPGYQSMSAFPDLHDGTMNGLSFNSPNTMAAMTMNMSPSHVNRIDKRNMGRAAYNGAGSGSPAFHGHDYIWNSPNSYRHPNLGSFQWQNKIPPFMNNFPAQTPRLHGIAGAPSRMPNSVFLPQHVGSAPHLDPALFDGAAFRPDYMFPRAGGNCMDPCLVSAHGRIPSPQQRAHMFRSRNGMSSMPASHDAPSDRIRSRRTDAGSNQTDNRKQFELDIERIVRGEDSRTTLMIKNIPNKYTSKMLLATIDEQHKGTYDFIYLPIDFKNKCNVGYAFINMTDPQHIIPLYQAFDGKKWEKFNSEKVASLAYARIQGKSALVAHFQNSSLMNEDRRCRPILFRSEGPNAGDQEPFPVGLNVRPRRPRTNAEHHHQESSSVSSCDDEPSAVPGSPPKDSENEQQQRSQIFSG